MNDFYNYDDQWYPRMDGGLSFLDICLTVEEKPRKTRIRKTDPIGIEPWPARWQATMLQLDQSAGHKR